MDESQTTPKGGEEHRTTLEQYVDELADEGDYWLTITDAGRVTRRQEITIRRWVANGTLPVRKQRMGLNKRTRHVRASDLAQLTPIVDPTAAISGGPANADLLSIPVQQAQIMVTQHDLIQQMTQIADQFLALQRRLAEQQTQHTADVRSLRAVVIERFAQGQSQLTEGLAALQADVFQHREAQTQHSEQLANRLREDMAAQDAIHTQHFLALEEANTSVAQQVALHATLLSTLQQELMAQATHRTIVAQILQQVQTDLTQGLQDVHTVTEAVTILQHLQDQQASVLQEEQDRHARAENRSRLLEQRLALLEQRVRRSKRRQRSK